MPPPHLPPILGGAGDEGDSPEGAAVSQQSLSPDPVIVRQVPNLPATIDDGLPTPQSSSGGECGGTQGQRSAPLRSTPEEIFAALVAEMKDSPDIGQVRHGDLWCGSYSRRSSLVYR
uniref:Uncharacterized protein n=1 Tax=Peronospora matthiolae TaxID=2874970 RepID=A0AAV1T189_9STRA